jgi:hypothetical protein
LRGGEGDETWRREEKWRGIEGSSWREMREVVNGLLRPKGC